ncbi:multidrug effflux MFS transporter [Pedobacter jeongneungensis]|uniref:multidrug effflux MFS transporter n=1 Tax=Pedobacter jeongneungensis TaxID=947309 RepID=UPI0031E3099E
MTKKRYYSLLILLGMLTAMAPFSIDTYLPGFPSIAETFGISVSKVTLSLSSFFVGIALGQVIYGPLLDRFGRKRPLYLGLILYLVATVGCYLSQSIETLVFFRFIQAIGSCSAGVVSMVMVRDLFPLGENAKIYSILTLVMGTSPMVAPTIGGVISAVFGWRMIFLVLFALAISLLIAVFVILPESKAPDKSHSLKLGEILRGYWAVLGVPQFLVYAIGGGFALSGLFAYISSSPAIFMKGYRVSNYKYGWIFAVVTVGFVGLGQLSRILSRFFKAEKIVFGAVVFMILLSLILLLGLILGWFGLFATAGMIFLILGCIGVLNPNAAALSMAPFDHNAGSAASLYGLFQWGIAGVISSVVSLLDSTSAVSLSLIIIGTGTISIMILFFGKAAFNKNNI